MKVQVQRLAGVVALALSALAIVAGAANAERPDDRGGMLGVGAAQSNDPAGLGSVDGVLRSGATRPDDRDGVRGPGMIAARRSSAPSVVSGDDFRWGDAFLGAGATIGVLMLGAALVIALRSRGRLSVP